MDWLSRMDGDLRMGTHETGSEAGANSPAISDGDRTDSGPASPPQAGPQAEAASGGSGAPPCNTAPDTCIGGYPLRVLRVGVDSLYLSYRGRLSQTWDTKLRNLKYDAQSSDPEEVAKAQVLIGDQLFEVQDKGSRRYAFVLLDNCFRIQIASREATSLPLAHVQISSELLTLQGYIEAERQARFVVCTFGLVSGPAKVSRVDLCADVETSYPMDSWPASAWVTRAHRIDPHYVQGRFSGWSIGSGSSLVCRLYDKTLELERKPREYLTALWRESGWDGLQKVWRLEFQFRREVLKELGISSPDELPGALGSLWAYATTQWLRLTLPSADDQTRSRWDTHPLWQALAQIPWQSPSAPLARVRTERVPTDSHLFRQGLAGLTSYMAARRIFDVQEGMQRYLSDAAGYHNHTSAKSFKQYVLERLRLKARRYNSVNNTTRDAEEFTRSADAYRRAKDGE